MTKKMFSKILCIVLALITVFSCVACNKNDDDDSTEPETNDTTHDFVYTETEDYLLRNGETEYTIVVPSKASTVIGYAREELTRYFAEATGVTLRTVLDTELTHNANNKYISIGETTLFATSGLTVDKAALTRDGARILTKDKTVYLLGGSDNGALYATYDFLNIHFGFDTFAKDCYSLETGVKNIKLMNYDVTDIPDIEMRARGGTRYSTTSDTDDIMYSYRLRTTDAYWKSVLPIHVGTDKSSKSAADHNCFYYLPREVYEDDYPEFYSNQGEQLCYTARGDVEKFDKMVQFCADKVIQSLKFYPVETHSQYVAVQLGIADNYDFCECEACRADFNKYGAAAGSVIIFLNALGKRVNDWMATEEGKPYARDLQYMFFAYYDLQKPPYYKNEETGKYEAADNRVMPAEGVKIIPFCAFNSFDHGIGLYDDANANMREYATIWGEFYPGSWLWNYGCFFRDYFAFYDSYSFYADYYAFTSKLNYRFALVQQNSGQRGEDAAFFTLSTYLISKLMWDSSLDMDELIDKYMNAMYKEAAPIMNEMFVECRNWFNKTYTDEGWSSTAIQISATGVERYWTIGFVNTLFDYIDKAHAAIEVYKKDTATYEKLKGHIDLEWLFPAKVAITHYENYFTASEFAEIKARFKQLCIDFGITAAGEFDSIDTIFNML